MNLAFQIIYWLPLIVVILILLSLLRRNLKAGQIDPLLARRSGVIILVIVLAQQVAQLLGAYFSMKAEPIGPYLFRESGYIYNLVWPYLKVDILGTLIGVVLVLILVLIMRLSARPLIDYTEGVLIIISTFVSGYPNAIVVIFLSFVFMIIAQIGQVAIAKNITNRMNLGPYLLFTTILILILSRFNFYTNFMSLLRLQ